MARRFEQEINLNMRKKKWLAFVNAILFTSGQLLQQHRYQLTADDFFFHNVSLMTQLFYHESIAVQGK